jgi:uncharacterized SAM-binding protein YcdF (DUF218 family)
MAGPARLERADAIVVLGRGGVDADQVLTNRSLRRTLRGVELYQNGLAPLLVVSGSAGEAAARAELARGFGVPPDALLRVSGPQTTREEGATLAAALGPRGIRRVLLVADPIDMPRARALLERAGFTVFPAPTAATGPGQPEGRLSLLREMGLELGGWLYYRLAGYL